jgi:ABC-type sugar transport system substrate-binding protein
MDMRDDMGAQGRARISRRRGTVLAAVGLALVMGVSWAQEYTIGSMIWNTTIPFYSGLIQGQEDAAAERGIELLVRNGQGDLGQEIAVIQQFIAQGVDLILVSASDSQGIVPVIRQANEAGIPVISVNSTVGEGAEIVTYVGADDYMFGQEQGRLVVETIGSEGAIALILGHLGVSAQILREDGLESVLGDYPGIRIVAKQSADWDYAEALAITQDLLNRYPPGELDAIVSQGPEGVAGARYAQQVGRSDVLFITGDYPSAVRDAILAGVVHGTINQDPYPQGYRAVEVAHLYLTGRTEEIVAPHDYLPLPLVTQENAADMEAAW